ncbi:signal peptidase I [Bacteriovorax sp. BSW11_IV]|uniref:signal peptidase I n=1 Tax=Bacteriovorax sp. BSW11_IV TaxID=1353529 RepID=UPI000389DCB2|nr:signal peptidase I [Bacteriovorax sp. BSW11_IV]EQC44856.1 signal peptidase I [Bacteriovorax sp. BSW11_IV]
MEEGQNSNLSRKEAIKKEIKTISLIVFIILVFRSSFFEPFRIPSGSMIPTLMIGDFILVNKFSYGFKLPFSDFTFFDINFDPIVLFGKERPNRGDVIVFKFPKDTSTNYVKRVIGLPGDEIEIKDKIIYVNGNQLKTEEISGADFLSDMDENFKVYNLKFFKSQIGDHSHIIQQDSDNYYTNFYDKTIIPEGTYFVMGDNRDFSHDSRFWGFVPESYIKGKAIYVWFSMVLPFSGQEFKLRLSRVGKEIF